jgi:6-phosphofructo-2-kinase/fructose-2,6-biphosphatase
LGHDTKHFNVGQYRRVQKGNEEVQDASFFDPHNEVGVWKINIGKAEG